MARENSEPVVQIVTQAARGHRGLEVAVRRRHHAHVEGEFLPSAEPAHPTVLENPQHLRLESDGHLGDLVEEQRSPMCQLEAAGARRDRAGEGAFLVTEQLALEQPLRDGGGVDGDERAGAADAQVVDRARHQLLPGAALAGDDQRCVGRCHPLDQVVHLAHRGAGADQRAETGAAVERRVEPLGGAPAGETCGDRVERRAQLVVVERLGEEVLGTELHRLDGLIDPAVGVTG
jgi:hypothetical protein